MKTLDQIDKDHALRMYEFYRGLGLECPGGPFSVGNLENAGMWFRFIVANGITTWRCWNPEEYKLLHDLWLTATKESRSWISGSSKIPPIGAHMMDVIKVSHLEPRT